MTSTTSVQDKSWLWVFLAWLVALTATLGALFLGEVMGVLPCVLCWYQRIAMFPLVIILAVGLMPFEERSRRILCLVAKVLPVPMSKRCFLGLSPSLCYLLQPSP